MRYYGTTSGTFPSDKFITFSCWVYHSKYLFITFQFHIRTSSVRSINRCCYDIIRCEYVICIPGSTSRITRIDRTDLTVRSCRDPSGEHIYHKITNTGVKSLFYSKTGNSVCVNMWAYKVMISR